MTRGRTRLVVRFTDFNQPREIEVPQKLSEAAATQLALTLDGTLHRITVTDEPVPLNTQ